MRKQVAVSLRGILLMVGTIALAGCASEATGEATGETSGEDSTDGDGLEASSDAFDSANWDDDTGEAPYSGRPRYILRVDAKTFNRSHEVMLQFTTSFGRVDNNDVLVDKYFKLFDKNDAFVILKHAEKNGGGWVIFKTCDCIPAWSKTVQPLKVWRQSSSGVSTRGLKGDVLEVFGDFDLRNDPVENLGPFGVNPFIHTSDPARRVDLVFRK